MFGIRFKTYEEIKTFIQKLSEENRLENLHRELIIATNGNTYLLSDLKNQNSAEVNDDTLSFSDKDGIIHSLSEVKLASELLLQTFIYNKALAELLLDIHINK